MTKKPTKRRAVVKSEPELVIRESTADRWWRWGQRIVIALVPVFAGFWWLFGWYNGVEGLKATVGGLSTKVEALWSGQTSILDDQKKLKEGQAQISNILKRIEPVLDKAANR